MFREIGNPAVGAAGLQKNANIVGTMGTSGDSNPLRITQENYVVRRYRVSPPIAALVVDLHFNNGGQR
jgi:hypothetical protein